MRRPVGRRSRGSATTGPGADAGDRAGTRAQHSTSPSPQDERRDAAGPLTDAQILVGAASWLTSLRDWLAAEIDLADGETVSLRRAEAEKMRDGLTRCAALLDTCTVDPAQLPPLDDAPEGAPGPAVPSSRTLQ